MFRTLVLSCFAALLSPALAQTYTNCNPMNTTCPADPALAMEYNWNMTNATLDITNGIWNMTGPGISYVDNAAQFTMAKENDAPTIMTNFYIFGGSVSVIMKSAKGQGIVSSVVLQSDDLDEVDWEWLGGDNTQVQTNYYGKHNTTGKRSMPFNVTTPQDTWHNYTTVWSQSQIQWIIDGTVVRTLAYHDAWNNGEQFPQTPMNVRLGMWDGGDAPNPGTVTWAGGKTDWSGAPYNMVVSNVHIDDANRNVSSYVYGDQTGMWDSINKVSGKSTISHSLSDPPPPSLNDRFNGLSTGAKIGIFAGVAGFIAILVALCAFCCIRQRRAGRKERAVADAEYEAGTNELMAYRKKMAEGGFGSSGGRDSGMWSGNGKGVEGGKF